MSRLAYHDLDISEQPNLSITSENPDREKYKSNQVGYYVPYRFHFENITDAKGNPLDVILPFQEGPFTEGYNGVTPEAVLLAVKEHLLAYQKTTLKCNEFTIAVGYIEEAISTLFYRDQTRAFNGKYGTENP